MQPPLNYSNQLQVNKFPTNDGTVTQNITTDKTKSIVVQVTIKIDSCHKERDFTINMYTTTSKILVNGKNEQLFFQRDLRKIHSIINSATSNRGDTYIETLNTKLAEQL